MAIDKTRLTKNWIDYLKSNQIAVSSKESPGKLDYKKKVTSDNLSHFLEVKTDFTEEQISNAIHMVLAKKAQGGPAKLQNNPTPGTSVATQKPGAPEQQAPKQIGSNQPKAAPATPKKRYSKDNATDVEYRDVNEELNDNTAYTLDEKDVEDVLSILTSSSPAAPPASAPRRGQPSAQSATPAAPNPEEDQAKKEEEIRKLKRVIRDTMSPAQRKALWRVLTDA